MPSILLWLYYFCTIVTSILCSTLEVQPHTSCVSFFLVRILVSLLLYPFHPYILFSCLSHCSLFSLKTNCGGRVSLTLLVHYRWYKIGPQLSKTNFKILTCLVMWTGYCKEIMTLSAVVNCGKGKLWLKLVVHKPFIKKMRC